MEADQADASAARRLLDLPESCLHRIVSFMDRWTRFQFFRTSKGSQDEPGCAVLVLRASKPTLSYTHDRDDSPSPTLARLIHWAAQISKDMQLNTAYIGNHPVPDVLHSLLVYPQARTTRSGRALGRPAAYPGVTSLRVHNCGCSSFMPELVADAFPNLKSFYCGYWMPDRSQPLGPVLQGGLTHLQHVEVKMSYYPARTINHIAQQLSHMPSLTCLVIDNNVLQAVPAAVLAQLKKLQLDVDDKPTAKENAALKACSQLESLTVGHQGGDWVKALHLHAPSISVLDYPGDLSDENLPSLLALPHLTSLTVHDINLLSNDYSSAPCNWKHVKFTGVCTSHITKLPLHALDSPITCSMFAMCLSDPTADLAAIRAAKPHLLRLGGIKTSQGTLCIVVPPDSPITKEQAAEVLAEWASCLPVFEKISCHQDDKAIIEDAVTQLWPGVKLDWVSTSNFELYPEYYD